MVAENWFRRYPDYDLKASTCKTTEDCKAYDTSDNANDPHQCGMIEIYQVAAI